MTRKSLTRAAVWEFNSVLRRIAERLERNKASRASNIDRENDRLAALVQDAMHERAE
jgi:hypothetical protein